MQNSSWSNGSCCIQTGQCFVKTTKKDRGIQEKPTDGSLQLQSLAEIKMNAWLMCVCLLVAVCLRVCFIGETFFLSL